MTKRNPIPPRVNIINYVGTIVEFRNLEQICKDIRSGCLRYTDIEEYLWKEIKINCDEFIIYINDIRENDYTGNINNEYKNAFLNTLKNNLTNIIRKIVGSFIIDAIQRGVKPDRRDIERQGNIISGRLTKRSADYVEGLLLRGEISQEKRDELTPSLMRQPVTEINFGGNLQGNLIGTASDSEVQMTYTPNDFADIRSLITEIFDRRQEIGLSPEKLATLEAEVQTIQAQLAKKTPNRTILRETGKSIRTILEGAAASAIASGWLPALQRLLG